MAGTATGQILSSFRSEPLKTDVGEVEREAMRLAAVESYQLVGRARPDPLDGLARIAASAFEAPMASVTLVHREQQWFAGQTGLAEPGTSRAVSFSARLIDEPQPLVVADTRDDPLYRRLPYVTQTPPIRFYAGVPLVDDGGHVVGTLAVFDREPRQVGDAQMRLLQGLAGQAAHQLRAIRDAHRVRALTAELERRRELEADAVTSISHELRTPVTAMVGFLSLLGEMPELERYRAIFEPIVRDGYRLIDMVEPIVATLAPGPDDPQP